MKIFITTINFYVVSVGSLIEFRKINKELNSENIKILMFYPRK